MDQAPPQHLIQDGQQGPLELQQPPVSPQQLIPPKKLVTPPAPLVSLQLVPPAPMAMNWSYFKPKFSGNTDESQGAHILRTIDWMDTHNFDAGQRVRIL